MSPKPERQKRIQRRTVLIVGEGRAELAWLEHLKAVYHERHAGCTIKLENAYGKGAAHVINEAIAKQKRSAYDVVAAVFDTDKDWHPAVKAKADKHGIVLFANEPCLEAELLRLKSPREIASTDEAKRRFQAECEADALRAEYPKHFPKVLLDRQRDTKPALARLVILIKTGRLD